MNGHMENSSSTGPHFPAEIWWTILDLVIDSPNVFRTPYNGANWVQDAVSIFAYPRTLEQYWKMELDVYAISRVCKSWRQFIISKRFRKHVSCTTEIVQWERVMLHRTHAEELASLPYPRLRRIHLSNFITNVSDVLSYLEGLESYQNLTWLMIDWSTLIPWPWVHGRAPLVLVNLEVFISYSIWTNMLPSFKLPKLRHLFVNTNALPQDITLKDFIGPYSQTLQSIAITVRSGSGRPPDHEFPSWTEYPMLEELALDPVLMLNFAPLPRTHPLRRLHAPQWRRSDIENWLESDHLEKVQLLNAVFTDYGDVVNRSTGATSLVLWKDEMDALLARARERGIELVVGGSWQSVE